MANEVAGSKNGTENNTRTTFCLNNSKQMNPRLFIISVAVIMRLTNTKNYANKQFFQMVEWVYHRGHRRLHRTVQGFSETALFPMFYTNTVWFTVTFS